MNKEIPEYAGKQGEFRQWALRVREAVAFKGLSPQESGALTRLSLKGNALSYVIREDPRREWTFEHMLQQLNQEFDPWQPVAAYAYAVKLPPSRFSTFKQYMRAVEEAYDQAFPTGGSAHRDRTLIGIIVPNLPLELRSRIPAAAQHGTYSVFRTLVAEEEGLLQTMQASTADRTPRRSTIGTDLQERTRGILRTPKVTFKQNEISTTDKMQLQTEILEEMKEICKKDIAARFADIDSVMDHQQGEISRNLDRLKGNPLPSIQNKKTGCFHCGDPKHYRDNCLKYRRRYGRFPVSQGTQAKEGHYQGVDLTPENAASLHCYNQPSFFAPLKSTHPLSIERLARNSTIQTMDPLEDIASDYPEDEDEEGYFEEDDALSAFEEDLENSLYNE